MWLVKGRTSKSCPVSHCSTSPRYWLTVSQLPEAEPHGAPQLGRLGTAPRVLHMTWSQAVSPTPPGLVWCSAIAPSREVCLCATSISAYTAQGDLLKSRGQHRAHGQGQGGTGTAWRKLRPLEPIPTSVEFGCSSQPSPAQPTPPHCVSWAYGTHVGQRVLEINK